MAETCVETVGQGLEHVFDWVLVYLSTAVDLAELRIPGVLQRFALTYLVIALIHLIFYRKKDSHQVGILSLCPVSYTHLRAHETL